MSNTYVDSMPSALHDLPWVELDGGLGDTFKEFVVAADRRIKERQGRRKVAIASVEPIIELSDEYVAVGTADADFAAMVNAQDVPLVRSTADADALRELLHRPPRAKRPLPTPLPLDE
jgi:hypothetical protein